jgi:hypothetical protein
VVKAVKFRAALPEESTAFEAEVAQPSIAPKKNPSNTASLTPLVRCHVNIRMVNDVEILHISPATRDHELLIQGISR